MAKSRARAVVEKEKASVAPASDGLWSVAMLRIALEMKQRGTQDLEEIVDGVVGQMQIPREQFRKYLAEHLGLLREVDRRKSTP